MTQPCGYEIRRMRPEEFPLLWDFLYEAIFVPPDFEGEMPRSVITEDPKCRAAVEGFGTLPDDLAVVTAADGRVVGACWARTTDGYGHIDDETPSLSVSLYEEHRGKGLGGAMMRTMLAELGRAGYRRASLSVQKANPACICSGPACRCRRLAAPPFPCRRPIPPCVCTSAWAFASRAPAPTTPNGSWCMT